MGSTAEGAGHLTAPDLFSARCFLPSPEQGREWKLHELPACLLLPGEAGAAPIPCAALGGCRWVQALASRSAAPSRCSCQLPSQGWLESLLPSP